MKRLPEYPEYAEMRHTVYSLYLKLQGTEQNMLSYH